MKLAQSLRVALIITGSASFVIPFALAEFSIIVVRDNDDRLATIWAVPGLTESFSCSSFDDNSADPHTPKNGVEVSIDNDSGSFTVSLKASTDPGLCGLGQLDFYRKNEHGNFLYYLHQGNGSSLGTCYPNKNSMSTRPCSKVTLLDDGFDCNNTVICN